MRKAASLVCSASLIALAGFMSMPANAQNAPSPRSQPPQNAAELSDAAVVRPTDSNQSASEKVDKADADVIVTGSRTISNGNNSPTPLTVAQTKDLLATTPSTLADALATLPSFAGGRGRSGLGQASTNGVGSFLNLRGLGSIRNLVLLDGRRVPASAANGTVDTDTLPEMLTQRIDIVTGGAGAVYGSDAVSGVINYVLDHNFNGLRVEGQGGVSARNDDASWKLGAAAGHRFAEGRLHLEGSFQHYNSDGVKSRLSRPAGHGLYCGIGNGTTIPIVITPNCRQSNITTGGLILSGPGMGLQFSSNGVLTPFVNGINTVNTGLQIGGDGVANFGDTFLAASLKTDQAFGRADVDFGSDIHGFVQASWNRSESFNKFTNFGPNSTLTFSTSNPFLSPAVQAQLSAGGATTFRLNRNYTDAPGFGVSAITHSWTATAGLDGRIGRNFNWSLYYTHGATRLTSTTRNNVDQAKLFAAADAVRDPSGNIVCSVSLTNPGLFPGCVPLNIFGPSTLSAPGAFDYPRVNTRADLTNKIDDVGATISGNLANLPAGPLRVAITGEYRNLTLTNVSHFTPLQTVQNSNGGGCLGLRFNCVPSANTLLYFLSTTTPVRASEYVEEIAAEATIPVLKGASFAYDLSINGAVRYARYSASGDATTWKVGIDWHPIEDLTFRGTRSRDIRAPTLFDLYQPATAAPILFDDSAHTGVQQLTRSLSQGNSGLVPEIAKTWTAGAVYRPGWVPGFSISLDYYEIVIRQGITLFGANATSNQICEASGGTSPLCAIFQRPFPFSNHTAANFPTLLLPQSLNVATIATHGVDGEANYNFSVPEPIGGRMALRLLTTYQPNLDTVSLPGQAATPTMGYGANPKWRATLFANYSKGPFALNVQERWNSSTKQSFNLVYANPNISQAFYTDLNLRWTFLDAAKQSASVFLSVQNAFDRQPSLSLTQGINFAYPTVPGQDVIGRYLTAGIRARF